MKRVALLAILLTSIVCAGSRAATQTPPPQGIGDRNVYQETLANGLQVIVVEDHAAPVVQESVWYRFGSLYETPGKTGLAHALEHMMFRGTPTLSAGGLDNLTARLGAQVNGQTDYDYTQFYFVVPSDKLSVAMAIDADRMQHLALRPADWNIERLAVLNELDGDESSPFFNLLSRVRAAAYYGLPSGRTPVGKRSDVANSTVADIAKYYHEWYAPNNAALVVAGDVQHASVFALAQRDFGGIPARPLPPITLAHPTAATGKTVEAQFPYPFEVLDLAYAVPGDTEPGEPAVSTLATLIANERGPFYQALVQTNIALGLDANADTQLRGGLLHVFIMLNPGHTGEEAQTAFQTAMDRVLKDGFTPDLVSAAKMLTIAQRVLGADSISGYGDLVGYTYSVVRERVRDEDARLAALTPQTLLAAARRYLATPNVVGHLRPSDKPSAGISQKSNAAATDNFSSRVPNGPIVEPAALRAAVRKPSTARSKLDPVRFTLANGLRVVFQEKHDRPTVTIAGVIESSPAFSPPAKEGIARLASTVADFGSDHYDFARLRKVTDDIGAFVSLGQTFSARGFARNFTTLLSVLADGEEHPAFPERWLSLQRDQLANSIGRENDISGVQIDRAYLRRLLSPDDPGLRFPSALSIASISRDDLLAYTRRYWRPDLTSIAIVGDLTPEEARRDVEAAFGTWSAEGPKPDATEVPFPAAQGGEDYIATAASQVYIRLGQPAVPRAGRDFYAFTLLAEIIGGSGNFESRLWQELRQKRGLVYSVGSSLLASHDRGEFRIEMSAPPAKAAGAVRIVRAELERLQREPVTPTELQEAKTRLVSGALLAQESSQGQADELLDILRNDLPTNYYATLNDRYAGISAADLERVAKTYLHPDQLIEVFSGPPGPWTAHPI